MVKISYAFVNAWVQLRLLCWVYKVGLVVGVTELINEMIRWEKVRFPSTPNIILTILTSVVKIKLLNKNARSSFQSFKAI